MFPEGEKYTPATKNTILLIFNLKIIHSLVISIIKTFKFFFTKNNSPDLNLPSLFSLKALLNISSKLEQFSLGSCINQCSEMNMMSNSKSSSMDSKKQFEPPQLKETIFNIEPAFTCFIESGFREGIPSGMQGSSCHWAGLELR